MNTKEWWQIYRQIYREYGITRQELIEYSKIEPAQWARLERGEGSPTSDIIQKVHFALESVLLSKGLAIPKRLQDLPSCVDDTLDHEDIDNSFRRLFHREVGFRGRHLRAEQVPLFRQEEVLRNCESIAIGEDWQSPHHAHRPVNFPNILEDFLQDGTKNVLWYPSADQDVRSLIFFSESFNRLVRSKRESSNGILKTPDLFIYTSLCYQKRFWPSRMLWGHEGSFLTDSQAPILYHDGRSSITIRRFQSLYLDRQKHPFIKGYATFGADPREYHCPDGYWLDLELTSKKFPEVKESMKMLYLFHENIHFWDSWIVGSGLFAPNRLRLQSLVCSREGLGMGGCQRSALIHWLEMPLDIKKEFAPEYIVAFSDFTNSELHLASQRDGFTLTELGPYIPERGGGLMDRVYQVGW